MSPLVELSIVDPPLFGDLYDAVPELETTLEDAHYFSEGEGNHYDLFWWVSGCDFAEFERAARDYRHTRALQQITAVEGRRLYRITTEPLPEERMLFPYFRRHDISMLDVAGSGEGFWARLRVPDRETLRTLVDKLEALDANPRIERIYTAAERADTGNVLTEKQCESIRLALDEGYFESPSQVTLEELATDLDITPQTLSKHIRSGVRKLVADQVRPSGKRADGSPACTD